MEGRLVGRREDNVYGRKITNLAITHASEAFVECDEPWVGGGFSAGVEVGTRGGFGGGC